MQDPVKDDNYIIFLIMLLFVLLCSIPTLITTNVISPKKSAANTVNTLEKGWSDFKVYCDSLKDTDD